MKLVIDGFTNPSEKVETGIAQELPVSLILFVIYINRVFSMVKIGLPNIIYTSFVNNLEYIISDCSIHKVARLFEKMRKITSECKTSNVVINDMSKTIVILFPKLDTKS